MSNRLVSIVIVTAGRGGMVFGLLDSLKGQTAPPAEVIVVDNTTGPALAGEIASRYPAVFVYPQGENTFYCRAVNTGIGKSRGDFVLCLNDDITLAADFLEKALGGFVLSPRIGLVSPKILRSDKKTIDSCGLFLGPAYTAVERGYGARDRGQFDSGGYVFGVNGAAAFYRREMLNDIAADGDYFDPQYRIFYEDMDLAWRAHRKGWWGYYLPSAVAYHARGATVRSAGDAGKPLARRYLNDELQADLVKNRYLTIVKNASCWGILAHLPALFLYDALMWMYLLIFKPRTIKKILGSLVVLGAAFARRRKSGA